MVKYYFIGSVGTFLGAAFPLALNLASVPLVVHCYIDTAFMALGSFFCLLTCEFLLFPLHFCN